MYQFCRMSAPWCVCTGTLAWRAAADVLVLPNERTLMRVCTETQAWRAAADVSVLPNERTLMRVCTETLAWRAAGGVISFAE